MKLVVMQQGTVDFEQVPTEALTEIAGKYAIDAVDRKIMVNALSERLLTMEGLALLDVLKDLRSAAIRYGDTESVVLTSKF